MEEEFAFIVKDLFMGPEAIADPYKIPREVLWFSLVGWPDGEEGFLGDLDCPKSLAMLAWCKVNKPRAMQIIAGVLGLV